MTNKRRLHLTAEQQRVYIEKKAAFNATVETPIDPSKSASWNRKHHKELFLATKPLG